MATSGTNWHDSAKLQTALTNFHNKDTRFPTREVTEAKQALLGYLQKFDLKLRSVGFGVRVEYTGSSYEGIKVDADDLEFDVMIIMTNGDKLSFEHVPGHPGFSRIKPNSPQNEVCFATFLDSNKMLVPTKVIDKLQGHLTDVCSQTNEIPNVILRRHGPAIQVDVRKRGKLWFSIDMVPAIEIRANGAVKRFVAKPFKGEVGNGASSFPTAWRCSYSLEEKALLKDIDKGNECRKQTARIVKSLRNREAALSCICSYWIKTTILRLKNSGSWDQANLGRCVMRVLESLAQAFKTGNLPHYFVPQLNLLSGETPIALQNLESRLRVLLRNDSEFYRAIGMLV